MNKKWAALFYVVLVFAAGVVAGSLGTRLYAGKSVAAVTSPSSSPAQWRERYVGEMKTRLKLTDGQVQQLNTILDETRAKYRAARERAKPEMTRIHEDQIAQINAILNDGQKPEYERIVEEHDRQRKLREAGGR